jgi:hypothetical protein
LFGALSRPLFQTFLESSHSNFRDCRWFGQPNPQLPLFGVKHVPQLIRVVVFVNSWEGLHAFIISIDPIRLDVRHTGEGDAPFRLRIIGMVGQADPNRACIAIRLDKCDPLSKSQRDSIFEARSQLYAPNDRVDRARGVEQPLPKGMIECSVSNALFLASFEVV